MNQKILIWDLPTRIFHWLLAISVAAALITGEIGGTLIDLHGKLGLLMVGLIAFRITWGFVGSTYARFRQFFPGPHKIKTYLAGQWHGEGHNPLGALSVVGLLLLLTAQLGTGLFANDDITFKGPLFALVSESMSNVLTGIHHLISSLLITLVGLHIAAILFYTKIKGQNLIVPMITGYKEGEPSLSAKRARLVALLLAMTVGLGAIYGASGDWLPQQAIPAATETPNW